MDGNVFQSIKLEPDECNRSFEVDLKTTVILPIEAQERQSQDLDQSTYFRCFKCEHPFHTELGRRNHESVCKAIGPNIDLTCSKFDKTHEDTFSFRATVIIFEKSLFKNICRDQDVDISLTGRDVLETKHTNPSQIDMSCNRCLLVFPNMERFAQHEIAHTCLKETEATFPHICGDCGQDFPTLEAVDVHITNSSNACQNRPKVVFPCRICHRMFQRRDKLREHIMDHLGGVTAEPKYKCKHCQMSFEGVTLFAIHLRGHNGNDSIVCKTCRKTFHSESALKKHERIHTGEKPFGCDKCSSRFFARETLNRHQKVHENALGDLLYGSVHSCQTCNRDFSKRGDLDKHLNLIHNHRFETSSDPKNSGLQSKRFKHAAKTYTRKRAVKIESSISIKNEPLFGDEK